MSGYYHLSLAWDGSGLYAGWTGTVSGATTRDGGLDRHRRRSEQLQHLVPGLGRHRPLRGDVRRRRLALRPGRPTWTNTGGGVSGYCVRLPGLGRLRPLRGITRDLARRVALRPGNRGPWTSTGGRGERLRREVPGLGRLPASTRGTNGYGVWRYDTFTHGETVDLKALPDTATGYHFVNWTEEGMEVSTSAAYSFTATADRDLVAHFALNQYAITTAADPPAGGVVTGTKAWTDTGGGVSSYSLLLPGLGRLRPLRGDDGPRRVALRPGTETWTDTGGGVSGYVVLSLAWDGTGLYAGTDGHGVWHYDPATEPGPTPAAE